ncbi:hypothetical protein, partial [Vibrio alfacsensis]|uniref:hypothetical protein n=1 Tax=Vibrio alfacsensis TaxID=1074311 RepID=UPI0040680530
IGFFALLYSGSNVPFTFSPVALDAQFARCQRRLRFLTFRQFHWRGFFVSDGFAAKNRFFGVVGKARSQPPLQI